MDNFDLKKYLVENKVTTNSQMLDEAANLKDIMSKLQAGDFASLAKMPGDQKLAQTILKTLKQSQPELLKKLTAYAKKNEKMLAEASIKTTLLGLLMALSLGTGISVTTLGSKYKIPVDTELTAQGQTTREFKHYQTDYETQLAILRTSGLDQETQNDVFALKNGNFTDIKNPEKLIKLLHRWDISHANFGDYSK
jgi:hypothetical protein